MSAASGSAAVELAAGDLVVIDRVARVVVRVDPNTGAQTLISPINAGATDVAVDRNRRIWVTASNASGGTLIRVDPETGDRTLVASGLSEGQATGVSVAPNGKIIMGSFGIGSALRSYNPYTGITTTLGELNRDLQGVAVAAGGDIFDAPEISQEVRRLEATGAFQQNYPLIGPPGQEFGRPGDIAFTPDGQLIVVDDIRSVFVKLDIASGAQTIIEPLLFASFPFGLAVEASGDFVFPAVLGSGSALWRFDPVTQTADLITSGGFLSEDSGLISVAVVPPAVVPALSPGAASVLATLLLLSAALAVRRSTRHSA